VPELELLRAAAPTAAPPTPAARDRARADLERRLVSVRAPRSARRPRWLLPVAAASAAAACAVVLALAVRGDEPASAATALRHAAAAAERQPALPPLRAGQYAYTRSSDTWMTVAVGSQDGETGESTPTYGFMVPVERQVWRGPDGRGWLRQTSGEATFLSARDRELWIAAGRPDLGDRDEDVALGNDAGGDTPMATLTLTDDPDALRHDLEAGLAGDADGGPLAPRMFTAVGDYLRETATTPAQRAALYEVAAAIDGVELLGDVTDHAGRPGTAVAIDDAAQGVRHTMVFDPHTGVLLEELDVTLAANPYGYDAGVTVGRSTYLESRIVDAIPPR
jgi:hypothetical protein